MVGWLTLQHSVKSQAQTEPGGGCELAQDGEADRIGDRLEELDVRIG